MKTWERVAVGAGIGMSVACLLPFVLIPLGIARGDDVTKITLAAMVALTVAGALAGRRDHP